MKSFLVFQLEDCFGIFFYKSLTRIDYLSHLWVNSIEDNYSKIIVININNFNLLTVLYSLSQGVFSKDFEK